MKYAIGILLALFILVVGCIGSCVHGINVSNTAELQLVASGKIQPIADCFGTTKDYALDGLQLVKDGIAWEDSDTEGSRNGLFYIRKVDARNRQSMGIELRYFYLKDYQPDKAYSIYRSEGGFLWWYFTNYYIGCE